ncbi:MAG: TonB-dependent receptor, partial [Alphaproteobacteria bacterium]|nr:TonB-dependent receptor [Alphaproteobacteria bacterium]
MTLNSRQFAIRAGLFVTTTAYAMLFTATGVQAQQSQASDGSTQNDIVVIGTRRTDRTATNSASPVDIISAKTLSNQPSANIIDAINNIVPSFYVGQNSISDASTFVRSPSLRGLPGDETLVMLDGKRYNRSALVQVYTGGDTGLSFGSQGSDMSAIPMIAIGALDVLRDGAAEEYGSDAIAGVLNFGLKKNRSGFEADAQYGQYYDHGDGKSKELSASWGLALGDNGYADISGEYDDDGGTSRGVTRVTAYDLANPQAGNTLAAVDPGFTSPSQIPNYPGPAQIWGSSPEYGYKLLLNAGFNVSANSKVYLILNVAHSHAVESFNYRPSVGTKVTDPTGVTTVDAAGVNHNMGANGAFNNINCTAADIAAYPTSCAGGIFNFRQWYPGGFTPQFVGVTDEAWGVLGYKGKTDSGLTYDLSGSLSRNALTLSMYNSLNSSYGPESQTSFNFGQLIQREASLNLDMSYPLQVGLAAPLTVAWGGEYREEDYTQTAGDVQSYAAGPYAAQGFSPGASGYGGTSPNSAGTWSQSDFAGYLDLETDLMKNLSVGAAARYEHYNTFGDASVGKINAIYTITPGFKIRGSFGTGFHAPSPGQS